MSNVLRLKRRHFLAGAGGFTLALPFLTSLEKKAHAGGTRKPFFVAMATPHGGVWNQNMWPDESLANQSAQIYPGHTMHYGAIAPETSGSDTVISPCLTAPSNVLTPSLAAKMNLLRGLDYSF